VGCEPRFSQFSESADDRVPDSKCHSMCLNSSIVKGMVRQRVNHCQSDVVSNCRLKKLGKDCRY
jgi:hypothetical protein